MPKSRLKWLETLGGPHLLVSTESLRSWNGLERAFDHLSSEDISDYARACRIKNWVGMIEVGESNALVLSGDAGAISWISNSDSIGGLLVQWIGADSEQQILEGIENGSVLNCLTDSNAERLIYSVNGSGLMYLIDSVDSGKDLRQPYINIDMTAGEYLVESGYFEDPDLMLIVRRFTKTPC